MKTRKFVLLFVIALFASTWATPSSAQTSFDDFQKQAQKYKALKKVPNIKFLNKNRKHTTIADFKGNVVLLNFWASWCGPCLQEMPYLDKLQKELKNEDFVVVAVNEDFKGKKTAERFFKRLDIKYLDLYIDRKNRLMNGMGVQSLPHTILINKNGEIIREYAGFSEALYKSVVNDVKTELGKKE